MTLGLGVLCERALFERGEMDVTQRGIFERFKRGPERVFAEDAERERFERFKRTAIAGRRAAEFETADFFAETREEVFHATRFEPEIAHERFELLAIVGNLAKEMRGEFAKQRVAVVTRETPHHF